MIAEATQIQFKKLSDLCLLITDGTHASPTARSQGHHLYLTSKNIRPNALDLTDVSYVSSQDHEIIYRACPVRFGDVLFVKDGANAGFAATNELSEQFSLLSSVALIRPDPPVLDAKYLMHWLNTDQAYDRMNQRMSGSAIRRIVLREINDLRVPVLPIEQQKRIAAILDKADAIRRKREQAVKFADQFLRSLFLDMFGDPIRNPRRWSSTCVKRLCTLVRGSSPRPKGDPRYYRGVVPRLMVADLTRDGLFVTPRIDSLTEAGARLSRPVPAGTVVMAVSGNVGLSAIVMIDSCVHDGFVAFVQLKHDIVRPKFLLFCLQAMKATHARTMAGAIFKNVTTNDVEVMQIPLPPLDLQIEFENRLASVNALIANLKKIRAGACDFFEVTQRRAFRGEL